MVIDDAGLSRFALGVAPAAGVMLAVLVSILIFQLAHISVSERESREQIRVAAYELYELLLYQMQFVHIYFKELKEFEAYSHRIASLSQVHSTEEIPDYISWRIQTADILLKAASIVNRIDDTEYISEGEERFHFEFVYRMAELDAGIQYNQVSVIISRRVASIVKFAAGIAAGLLLLSIIIALAADMQYGPGIPDNWNYTFAVILISVIMLLTVLFGVLVFEVGKSSSKAIEAASERHISKLPNLQSTKKPSAVTRVWRFIRPSTP